ncbi:tetratricopeptide repeat protein [Azospirillum sp.]|uniref:tetratricopeptide repeat protein n=1 Tax=Azospirillum sp. TaxID=34012 RepID=UPI003D757DCE
MVSADGSQAQTVIDIPFVERLLTADPHNGGAWSTLGVLLRRTGKMHAAAACHRRGLGTEPENGAVWSNLGNVLTEMGQHDLAVAAHERAYTLTPDSLSLAFNYAIGLRKAGRFTAALAVLERALRLDPDNAQLLWERSLSCLQVGRYARGLEDYEARRGIPSYRNRIAPGTPWDGGPLEGRTIFLSTEQGFGDTLLAARYVPLVKAKGGRVVMECHPELRRILADVGADEFVPAGAPFPHYDVQASLMSLPMLLGTRYDSVPAPVRITVPGASREKAARMVGPDDGALKVGIVWSGRVTFADNARRATGLDQFLRFAGIPGVRLYSLQKGPPESQLAELGTTALVTPLGPMFEDFGDTAAAIERLDLVMMTDSSVAHLAGSLGKPIWNLVQYVPYWIYGHEGDRTPWYPSMRLFRQGIEEDWTPVFAQAHRALADLAAQRRNGAV